MKTVQNLVEGEAKMNFPAIIRKGRNTLSMLCGHKDNIKKFFTTCNDAFLSQLEAHLDPTNESSLFMASLVFVAICRVFEFLIISYYSYSSDYLLVFVRGPW